MREQLGGKVGEKRSVMMKNMMENLFIVILAFYPMRHVQWGLDLMDTGYNYANFTYMGTDHMDPMWLFSTWLSNAAGHLLTGLPGGGTLVGMNIYTGLFASLLALGGYWFCTRKLQIRPWIAFGGEMAALSLCWCPTALLYNYMTYVLFLGCFVLLYQGLTKDRKLCLICAGICLGANVMVRFSNLPEAAMILAVWVYDFLCAREERRNGGLSREGFLRKALRHTGWCLAGYLAVLAALLGYIHMSYGISEYTEGISRLFAMTDAAPDYRASSMVVNMLRDYTENLYWVIRMGVFLGAGMVLCILAGFIRGRAGVLLRRGAMAASVIFGAAMLWWLYCRGAEGPGGQRILFCTLDFYDYSSMHRPAILFLMLALLTAAIRIFHPRSRKEDRLVGGMLILVILLTAIGSNNRTFTSMNNLFIAAPYTLQGCWNFLREHRDKKIAGVTIPLFPVKCILAAFLLLCCLQFGGFGLKFAFAEAAGIRDVSAEVENNEVLKNVKMSGEKAEWMRSISAWVNERGLRGQEVILYGPIPSLSYYLQMPAAFNPWINLASYSCQAMAEDMRELEGETPAVILENEAALYEEGGRAAMTEAGMGEGSFEALESDEKLQMILNFMEQNGYEQAFRNEKFAVYISGQKTD